MGVAIVIIVAVLMFSAIGAYAAYKAGDLPFLAAPNHNTGTGTGNSNPPVTPPSGSNQVAVTQKLALSAVDALSGPQTALNSAVISIYGPNGLKVDGCTLSSNACTSSNAYTSGQTFTIGIAVSGYETEYLNNVMIPYATVGYTTTTIPMTVPDVLIGTGSLSVSIGGTTITSNATKVVGATDEDGTAAYLAGVGVYNFTKSGVSAATATVTLTNTKANSGWLTTNDPTNNNLPTSVVLDIANSNGTLSTSNIGNRFTIGTAYHWPVLVSDGMTIATGATTGTIQVGGFSSQTIGSGSQQGGTWTTTYTISKGTLTAGGGKCEQVTYTVDDYANVGYYQANGSPGPNYATLVSAYTNWYCA